MKARFFKAVVLALILCGVSSAHKVAVPLPNDFVVAVHTYFDFGPPSDYYELYVVRPKSAGTSIDRITLTPAGLACVAPPKLETASASSDASIADLLVGDNPCAIPEKDLRRESKRCKKCLNFSGVSVAIQARCGAASRIIRSDVLDRDMFDPAAHTPEHTGWTMELLARLEKVVGPGVMEKPMFPSFADDSPKSSEMNLPALAALRSGQYDALFAGAPDKPSELYLASQIPLPSPTIRLVSSSPVAPVEFIPPAYPPIARLAHVEGEVSFTFTVQPNGDVGELNFDSGSKLLRSTLAKAVSTWKFANLSSAEEVHATVSFVLNCPAANPH